MMGSEEDAYARNAANGSDEFASSQKLANWVDDGD